jgi:hypothetical protein
MCILIYDLSLEKKTYIQVVVTVAMRNGHKISPKIDVGLAGPFFCLIEFCVAMVIIYVN